MTTTAKKMVAKFSGCCPICDRKIKAGSDSIRYVASEPVAHWMCHERMLETVCPGYMEQSAFDVARGEERARWDAAVAKHGAKAQAPARGDDETDRGSLGGSQLAEDMGDYSGSR